MSVTIIVGGQYGSEGKGKVTALLAAQCAAPIVVRCGGPNSGHTVSVDDKHVVLRQLPVAVTHANATLMLSAGCAVDVDLALREAEQFNTSRDRIIVDPRAVLLTSEDRAAEELGIGRIGSTGSGTGAALMRRMMRGTDVQLAGSSERLRHRMRVEAVAPLLHKQLKQGADVIVEGTQGFGLSLLHSPHFPFVTSRDTTASAFASEVGISPRDITSIIMVIRTFPIRVGGNSGPLASEMTWEDVQLVSGAPQVFPELTSVTKRLRRVARFDLEGVKTACEYNRPTALAIMGLDRIDYSNHGLRDAQMLSEKALHFVRDIEHATGVPVAWAGTGFHTDEAIRLSQ